MAEIGALLPLADDDTSLSLKDINEKVGKEKKRMGVVGGPLRFTGT